MRRSARSRGIGLTIGLLSLSVGQVATATGARGPQLDLIGTWFVLIHYRDADTANPQVDRWEDRVWTFEKKGSRLYWTDYPIVVFDDPSGRFETLGRNPRARTLQAWEPNPGQRQQIAEGPRVNSRGSKRKSLRGSLEQGFRSVGRMRAVSASVVGYHEKWSIERPGTLPVFSRVDVMGTGRSAQTGGADQNMEGVTRYETLELDATGNWLRGSYRRDENRLGVFQMFRAGAVRSLESDGRTPNQKAADRVREAILEEVDRRVNEGDPETIRELREALRKSRERQP